MAEPIIRLTGLTKRFGGGADQVRALSDINLEIQRGEIFGVIGLSGAGKSTLVRCINLLERPTAGSVVVDGREMTALSPRELRQARKSIGMIFQGFHLLMQRTALENVCFPLELAGKPRQEAAERARSLDRVRVRGLMTVPPIAREPHGNLPYFGEVSRLYVDISRKLYDNSFAYLSMGMSDDFEDAIAAGATMVRVGSAIFGRRQYQ